MSKYCTIIKNHYEQYWDYFLKITDANNTKEKARKYNKWSLEDLDTSSKLATIYNALCKD